LAASAAGQAIATHAAGSAISAGTSGSSLSSNTSDASITPYRLIALERGARDRDRGDSRSHVDTTALGSPASTALTTDPAGSADSAVATVTAVTARSGRPAWVRDASASGTALSTMAARATDSACATCASRATDRLVVAERGAVGQGDRPTRDVHAPSGSETRLTALAALAARKALATVGPGSA
jgi:hypothetical protein